MKVIHYLSYMIKPLAESGHHFPIGKVLICAYNGYNNVFMSIWHQSGLLKMHQNDKIILWFIGHINFNISHLTSWFKFKIILCYHYEIYLPLWQRIMDYTCHWEIYLPSPSCYHGILHLAKEKMEEHSSTWHNWLTQIQI